MTKLLRKPVRKYVLDLGESITSLSQAIDVASTLRPSGGDFVVFRGQPCHVQTLKPKVYREQSWFAHEQDMVRELISSHPEEFASDRLMLDRLVRMQHYGLPTRLLDVTTNFLVALYFACQKSAEDPDDGAVFVIRGEQSLRKYYDSDAVSLVANLANLSDIEKFALFSEAPENAEEPEGDEFNKFECTDRLLQFVRDEKPYFRNMAQKTDLQSTFYVTPKKNNRRIIAQSGAFLIFGLVGRNLTPALEGFSISHHRISSNDKRPLLDALGALGISESSLFPELDRAAKSISDSYRDTF